MGMNQSGLSSTNIPNAADITLSRNVTLLEGSHPNEVPAHLLSQSAPPHPRYHHDSRQRPTSEIRAALGENRHTDTHGSHHTSHLLYGQTARGRVDSGGATSTQNRASHHLNSAPVRPPSVKETQVSRRCTKTIYSDGTLILADKLDRA